MHMTEQEINEAVMNTVINFAKLPKEEMRNVIPLLTNMVEAKEN